MKIIKEFKIEMDGFESGVVTDLMHKWYHARVGSEKGGAMDNLKSYINTLLNRGFRLGEKEANGKMNH